MTNPYRDLPAIDHLLADDQVAALAAQHGHDAIVDIARTVLDDYRAEIQRVGAIPEKPAAEVVVERASDLEPSLRNVINATGVIIHTNLGRAPLSEATIVAMSAASKGYSNLEFELKNGSRGSRFSHLNELLQRVTGAETGIAVNNNASAVLLALTALCAGSEVIISRGQLVEIGGGFRIPDVMRQSGATLVEVGTTNRTYLRDYAEAITDQTVALLRVHPSNFHVVGFTEATPVQSLAKLAHKHGLMLIDDLGSGALIDPRPYGLGMEPLVSESVTAGTDVTLFSGDKLVGGPQAGIAVGRKSAISSMQRHPLARAVRMDKASIAGLAATLGHYARDEAVSEVPVWQMIAAPIDQLRRRARRWVRVCSEEVNASVAISRSVVGGGSLPSQGLESVVCSIPNPPEGADLFTAKLRMMNPPIVARIERDAVLLDPRTVESSNDRYIEASLRSLCEDTSTGSGRSTGR